MQPFVALFSITLLAGPSAGDKFPPLPVKVSSHGACACDGWLYVYGGHTGATHTYSTETVTNRFVRIKLTGGAWEELPTGPAVQGLALVACKGKVVRIGGMQPRNKPGDRADNHSLASCASYDPKTREWTALPDMPTGRSSHDAVVVGDKLYVVGGWDMRGAKEPTWHSTALVLDLAKPGAWHTIEQPFRRRALGAAAVEGKVYVVAGLGEMGPSGQVDIYDPQTGKRTVGTEFPNASGNGFSPSACIVGAALYASGPDGKIYALDGDRWQLAGTQEVKRFVHRLVPGADGTILVIGGSAREGDGRKVEEIQPTRKR